jgi:hypothetical protein
MNTTLPMLGKAQFTVFGVAQPHGSEPFAGRRLWWYLSHANLIVN